VWGTSGDYKKVMRLDLAGLTEIYVRAPRHRERLFHGIVNTHSMGS
jgi:hypothetical protein